MSRYDNQKRELTHFIDQKENVPAFIALTVGDAIHNLRAALDHVIWAMIGDKARNAWSVQFPFARSQADLEDAIQKREIALAGQRVVDVIRQLKPFDGGNRLLYALNKLDVEDKHKLISATVGTGELDANQTAEIFPNYGVRTDTRLIFSAGTVITMQGVPPGAIDGWMTRQAMRIFEYPRPNQPQFQVAFGDPGPMAGTPLVDGLMKMYAEVGKAVELLTHACAADD